MNLEPSFPATIIKQGFLKIFPKMAGNRELYPAK